MSTSFGHNGCDTLMLGFDYELRRRGFAGNSCQIVLELSTAIDPGRLEKRLAELAREHPILYSRPARGLNLKPCWKPTRATPVVRVHTDGPDLRLELFNEPLDIHRGELFRFDLSGRMLTLTWAHALMDAKSAEYFLALAGGDNTPELNLTEDWYTKRAALASGWRARGRQAWRELDRLDQFRNALPVSLATRRQPVTPRMKYQAVALSREDSARVRAHAGRLCGFLGETNFHLAATLLELHRLHERTGCPSASYVLPIPIGLRPKGERAPLFSNQITMMLHQFLPAQLANLEEAVTAVKTKNAAYLRDEHINPGIALAQMFRCLPLPLYMRLIKHELRGEICSLFFGETAAVDSALQNFLGATIETFVHVPAVTVPPGIGVVFYCFGDQLQFTFVHADGTLTDDEAGEFTARLRERLLNP
jgi:hypothetical protein